MEQVVTIREGQILLIRVSENPYPVTMTLTWEQLRELSLRNAKSKQKSRKSLTEGAKFSRMVRLYTRALETGKWSTGGTVDISDIAERFQKLFALLPVSEYANVTAKARNLLKNHSLGFVRKMSLEIERDSNER